MLIREFSFPTDLNSVLHLWSTMEKGVNLGRSDVLDELEKKLKRDPDLFLVATDNKEIIGTVLGGFDGRRGLIYHPEAMRFYEKRGWERMTQVIPFAKSFDCPENQTIL